ncbi:MAG: cupin domain-containing protein [Anaerolineales bacterium]|nr:cupin domain-containing protein [Anaerolineales bacterium]
MHEDLRQDAVAIGKKLLAARQGLKMSLRELASTAEISASMLSQIETGKAYPSVRSLYKIAAALNVPLDYFFPSEQNGEDHHAEEAVLEPHDYTASKLREAMLSAGADTRIAGFETAKKNTPVVSQSSRPRIELQTGIQWARLTVGAEPGAEFLEITYQPQAQSGQTMSSHSGREFGLVLEGELLVELAFESHVLHPGDSIIFDSTTPHRLSNTGEVPMRALWVVLNQD